MENNKTFTIIKPDAVADGKMGKVLCMILNHGFQVKAMKYLQLTTDQAKSFYAVHKERPFYGELVDFMTSGPVVVAILEKDNAVEDFRKLIGATNPDNAKKGTIRQACGTSIQQNAVHGSDCIENAEIEGNFFFSTTERF
jgi:nucleoside-diphosphate kinase